MGIGTQKRVAVLGAGLAGASCAIPLARSGYDVTLYEELSDVLQGASRWNEGRLHLGYVYGADTTLNTARQLLTGTLQFRPIVESLIETSIVPHCTEGDDTFLVHRDSVIAPDPLKSNLDAINALVRNHAEAENYIVDVRNTRIDPMSDNQLRDITENPDILAGFRVRERSVDTEWLCTRLVDVLHNTPGLTLRTDTKVSAARPSDTRDGAWTVQTDDGPHEDYDFVINTSWNGLLEIDQAAGLDLDFEWSHRFRMSIFAETDCDVPVDSMFITVGPFGIFKNHTNRRFYLSWYDTGLRTYSEDVTPKRPPPLTPAEKETFLDITRDRLVSLMPPVAEVFDKATRLQIHGGFVLAQGTGDIAHPDASLHRRDKFGVRRVGNYFSVDSGKFCTAPHVANSVVDTILGDARRTRLSVA